jgi:repressor LexA
MTTPSFIYLIEAENGLIKVGRAITPGDRVKAVRTHSPILARLIAQWPGGEAEEAALHVEFAEFRRHGEWFDSKGRFGSFAEGRRGLGVDTIPAWGDLIFAARREYWERRNYGRSNACGQRIKRGVEAAKKRLGLTKRQSECFEFIRSYIAEHSFSPSYQEIATALGLVSKGRVHALIHELAARGHLSMEGKKGRAIVLSDDPSILEAA